MGLEKLLNFNKESRELSERLRYILDVSRKGGDNISDIRRATRFTNIKHYVSELPDVSKRQLPKLNDIVLDLMNQFRKEKNPDTKKKIESAIIGAQQYRNNQFSKLYKANLGKDNSEVSDTLSDLMSVALGRGDRRTQYKYMDRFDYLGSEIGKLDKLSLNQIDQLRLMKNYFETNRYLAGKVKSNKILKRKRKNFLKQLNTVIEKGEKYHKYSAKTTYERDLAPSYRTMGRSRDFLKTVGAATLFLLGISVLGDIKSSKIPQNLEGYTKEPVVETIKYPTNTFFPVEDADFGVSIRENPKSKIDFVHLHKNESDALNVAKKLATEYGENLINVVDVNNPNKEERCVEIIDKNGKVYKIDPNRIYKEEKVEETIRHYDINGDFAKLSKSEQEALVQQVYEAGKRITDQLKEEIILGFHNNEYMTIKDFLENERFADIYINPSQNPHSFFVVTETKYFNDLKQLGFNVALQDGSVEGNGSLAFWAKENGKNCIIIEARKGNEEANYALASVAYDLVSGSGGLIASSVRGRAISGKDNYASAVSQQTNMGL